MRLVTFGCSLTYGQFLDNRDTQSWPALLGDKLNVEVINKGWHGSSNKEILYEILNFDFQPTDLCIVLWTNLYRWTIFKEDNILRLGAWQNTKQALSFVEHFWDDYDMSLDLYERANHVNRIVDRSYHIVSDNNILKKEPVWNRVNFLTDIDFHSIRKSYPTANDGKHPGPLAYKEFSNLLYEKINEA